MGVTFIKATFFWRYETYTTIQLNNNLPHVSCLHFRMWEVDWSKITELTIIIILHLIRPNKNIDISGRVIP